MELGAQMYTVRDFTKDLNGLSETLKKIADIGYKTVQVSGTCEYSPEWLKEELLKNGLRCVITHTSPDSMKADPVKVVNNHKVFDCKYIGLGCMPGGTAQDEEKYNEFVNAFLPVAHEFKKNGAMLMYHHHSEEFFELPNGKTVLQSLLDDFPVDEMGITMDTYWVQAGGGDPAQWLTDLKGRVPCIHLKDMGIEKGRVQKMMPIFEGNMNFNSILKAAEAAETKYLLIEQDNCNGEDPFNCLKRSYENLKAHGLR